jgi:cyanophycinase-like exopeptidase
MAPFEASLFEGRPKVYVQLATAAFQDGPDRVAYWHDLGREQANRLGVQQIVVPVGTREEADDPTNAALIAGAGVIYLSGGNPSYLANTLRGTVVGNAIVSEWRNGASLAGCSAGAMALTSWIPSLRHPHRGATEGLDVVPHLRIIPHFDYFSRIMPTIVDRYLQAPDTIATLIGIDEDTAIVGGPANWRVWGEGSAWLLDGTTRTQVACNETFTVPTVP